MKDDAKRLRGVPELKTGSRGVEWVRLGVLLGGAVAILPGCEKAARPESVGTREIARQAQPSQGVRVGDVILSDDFSSQGVARLPVRSGDPHVDQGYVGGEYLVRLSPSFAGPSYFVGPRALLANVQIAADVRLVGGTEARWVGVGCRLNIKAGRASGYYILGVSPATGHFGVERHDPDRRTEILPFQASEAIRRGNATNRLELTCAGSTIAARINGIEVGSAQDGTYESGLAMVAVGRVAAIPAEARFDNLVVREATREP